MHEIVGPPLNCGKRQFLESGGKRPRQLQRVYGSRGAGKQVLA